MKCLAIVAVALIARLCTAKFNNSSMAVNATLSTTASMNATLLSTLSTPLPDTGACIGKEYWVDGKVSTSCTTISCARTTFSQLTQYMACNIEKTPKDVLLIAANVVQYSAEVAKTVASTLPSSVFGNGSMTFSTDKFVVEAGYMNKEKSDLRRWSYMPNFLQGDFPRFTGKKDQFKISKLILSSGVSQYVTVLFKDLYSTSASFAFEEAKTSSMTTVENLGVYTTPARTGDGNAHSKWSTGSCHTYYSDRFKTICQCNSIGGYAVVSKVEEKPAGVKGFSRSFFTQISVAISGFIILGLICCIVNPIIAGCVHMERIKIMLSQDFAFMMVYFSFMIGVAVSENISQADIAAGFIHFFQTSVMSWLLVEGIYNYHSISALFDPEVTSPIFFYSTIGWGIPAAFSGACAGYPYKLQLSEFSWIKVSGMDLGYFVAGPLVSLLGILLLYVVIAYELSSWIGSRYDNVFSRAVEYVKRSSLMMVLALLTWISGIMARNKETSLSYNYLFLALYSMQGSAIIYLHLLKNKDISEFRALKKYAENESNKSATTIDDFMSLQSSMQFSRSDIWQSAPRLQEGADENEDHYESASRIALNEDDQKLEDIAEEEDGNISSGAEGFREEDFHDEDDDLLGHEREEDDNEYDDEGNIQHGDMEEEGEVRGRSRHDAEDDEENDYEPREPAGDYHNIEEEEVNNDLENGGQEDYKRFDDGEKEEGGVNDGRHGNDPGRSIHLEDKGRINYGEEEDGSYA
eukprot:gene16929-18636_t